MEMLLLLLDMMLMMMARMMRTIVVMMLVLLMMIMMLTEKVMVMKALHSAGAYEGDEEVRSDKFTLLDTICDDKPLVVGARVAIMAILDRGGGCAMIAKCLRPAR
eukprot:4988973-Pyramimonas_sp.AAC.1